MISLALAMIHWESTFDQHGFEMFVSLVDIPLVLWYLSFYCSPKTKNAVIGKLMLNSISMFIGRYSEYVENYIYAETDELDDVETGHTNSTRSGNVIMRRGFLYDGSKLANVCYHHIIYIIMCPFVAAWEMFNALRDAFIRDVRKFEV